MNTNLKIKHTTYPDGSVVNYMYGMTPPPVKNLNEVMKKALLNHVVQQNEFFPFPEQRTHLSKAG